MGAQEVVIVLVVLALIFGASRLPTLARNFGLGIKEFRKGIKEAGVDADDGGTDSASGTDTTTGSAPSANGSSAGDDVPAKRRD